MANFSIFISVLLISSVCLTCKAADFSRISEQKCMEYMTLKLETANSNDKDNCGSKDYVPFIVGGEPARFGEFPHMASVGWTQSPGVVLWQCGGSLISSKYVMTAAHCGFNRLSLNPEPDVARLGELSFNETNKYRQDFEIEKIIKHPDYRAKLIYNDIALLLLKEEVHFSKVIRPACLWTKPDFGHYEKVVATGWGSIGQLQDMSSGLLKVTLDLIDNSECSPFLRKFRRMPEGLLETQLCSGVLKGGKDTCQGDSGGPLQIRTNNDTCIYHIMGITSFGFVCGGENKPAIYTRISSYLDWIEEQVWTPLNDNQTLRKELHFT